MRLPSILSVTRRPGWSAHQVKRIWVAVAVLATALSITACGSDNEGESTDLAAAAAASTTTTSPSTATAPSVRPTGAPTTAQTIPAVSAVTYVIQAGDAVFGIATDHCTTAEAIATANGWSDGPNHTIHPGDVVSLPADICTSPEPNRDTTSTTPPIEGCGCTSGEIDRYEQFSVPTRRLSQIRSAFDMTSGTNAGQFSDPKCVVAYATGLEFEKGTGSKSDTLTALAALADTLPAYLTAYIDAWDTFISEHGDDAVRIITTYESQGEQAALADPSLDEVAYALRDDMWPHGRRRVSEFVNDTCAQFQI